MPIADRACWTIRGLRMTTAASPMPGNHRWTRVATTTDVTDERPHGLSSNGVELVLLRTPTGLHAYEGRCPHQGAPWAKGSSIAASSCAGITVGDSMRRRAVALTGPSVCARVPSGRRATRSGSMSPRQSHLPLAYRPPLPCVASRISRVLAACHCSATSCRSTSGSCTRCSRAGRASMAACIRFGSGLVAW